MQFTHEFEVPVAVDEAFTTLTDLERIAPCMPGATLTAVDGDGHHGTVKVKVGPVAMTFQGTARLAEADPVTRTARIEAAGRDQRGSGTATADVQASLAAKDGATTLVTVTTDIAITGKAARFGRGMMADVGAQIIAQFATALAAELEARPTVGEVAPAEPAAEPVAPAAIDLITASRGAVGKRMLPVAALATALLLWARRSRRRTAAR